MPILWRRLPWRRIWAISLWLAKKGRDRLERNLSESERQTLFDLMRKSKGRRRNLSKKEQERFVALVRQAVTGRKA
jgi:hypothetical protein